MQLLTYGLFYGFVDASIFLMGGATLVYHCRFCTSSTLLEAPLEVVYEILRIIISTSTSSLITPVHGNG